MSWRVGAAVVHRVTELTRWSFAPTDLFAAWTEEHSRYTRQRFPRAIDAEGRLVLSIHTYVVDLGEHRVLVDAGNGDRKHRPVLTAHDDLHAGYLGKLRRAGFASDTFDIVTNTHLHPDHCGGNTHLAGGEWVPSFPNAVYVLSRPDLDWARSVGAGAPESSVEADLARTFADSVEPVLPQSQSVVAPVTLVSAEDTVVRLLPAPGHSPGHCVVEIESADGRGALLTGDAIHHPAQLAHPELRQNGDHDPELASRTRGELLERAAARRWKLLTAHFPRGCPLELRTTDTGPDWVIRRR